MSYSEATLDHFHNPRRVGEARRATHEARRENPVCGDVASFSVRLAEGRLDEVRYRVFGCVAAIAACSMLAEMVEGVSPEQALGLAPQDLVEALGGLPTSKRHGAHLALDTLRETLETPSE